MKSIKILIAIILSLNLTGCFFEYDFSRRIVKQGNLLTQDKVSRLKIGMSKEEVLKLLGTSLLSPTFTNDRWDYAYTWRCGTGPILVKNLVLCFKDNKLTKIISNMPKERSKK